MGRYRSRTIARCCAIALSLLLAGCATTRDFSSVKSLAPAASTATASAGPLTLVLMPADVELSVLTAGGTLQPQAAWTDAAKSHLVTAVRESPALAGKRLVTYVPPETGEPAAATIAEIEHLHRAVGTAIIMHKMAVPLPTKKDRFDWSLGRDAAVLKAHAKADYALFVYLRDSFSSTGRVLTQIFAAALGVGLQGGQQLGFATLVDLSSGDVLWFNFLSSAAGDTRDLAGAKATVANLLEGMPR